MNVLKSRRILLVALLAAILLSAGYVSTLFLQHTTVHVVRTANGFVPNKISIRKGDSVTFSTDTGKEFWPASDAHPSHGVYPEFDPKKPIAPNTTWTFTFTKAGVWGFHDHLHSIFTGTIMVEGSRGEAAAACLKNKSAASLAAECWGPDVIGEMKKNGLSAAFGYVDQLYVSDPRFASNCHDVMHLLGSAAYEQFNADHSVIDLHQTSYCGYGFYHGFIEKMLAENGPSQYQEVAEYCRIVETKSGQAASGPCYHGIGHAIFDSLDGSVWGNPARMTSLALSECEKAVQVNWQRAQCGSGVFNSLANALSARNYYLSFDGFDTKLFCSRQEPLYQDGCYGEAGIGYISEKHLEPPAALAYIDSLPGDIQPYMYFIYFADRAKKLITVGSFPNDVMRAACVSLGGGEKGRGCVKGVIEGIREESPVGTSFRLSFPFCSAFPDDEPLKKYCGEQIQALTQSSEIESAGFQEACKNFIGRQGIGCVLKQ